MSIVVGPNYFTASADWGSGEWANPTAISGAPDGNHANWNAGAVNTSPPPTMKNGINLTGWLGSLTGYYKLSHILIELYCTSVTQTIPVEFIFPSQSFASLPISPALDYTNSSVAIPSTFQWITALDLDVSSYNFFGIGSTFSSFLLSIAQSPINQIAIDSIRMTLTFDDKFAGQTIYAKRRREFKMTRNNKVKIISRSKFKGAA